ncbi:MAG: hypothetical protein M3Y59_25535 [Myxococcota bacterium]|nr:hypothetical protein [Myxococcota bacterium]
MASSTATLQLHHRETFERNVTRSLIAGGVAGAVHFLSAQAANLAASVLGTAPTQLFPSADVLQFLPLSYATIAGVAVATARGDKLDRLMLAALGVVLPAVPWLFGFSAAWTVGLAAAAAGALMVRSHLSDRGEEGNVGGGRPGVLNYLLGAGLTGGLAVAGTQVARALSFRMEDFSTPPLIAAVLAGVVLALFVGLGSIAAHVALSADPVEARCEEVIPQLSGELKTLASRALTLYQQCGKSLAALPREPAREEMARTLGLMTREAVDLAAEWSGLETQLQSGAVQDLSAQQAELEASILTARDPVARQQLQLAASAIREEMAHLDELSLQRERVVAKLKAEVALLERARVALIGMRSGQMQLKAAELSALARKFNSLSSLQVAEARLAGAVATSAELEAQPFVVSSPVDPLAAAGGGSEPTRLKI